MFRSACSDWTVPCGVWNMKTWEPPSVDRLNEPVQLSYMYYVCVCVCVCVWEETQSVMPSIHRKRKLMYSRLSSLTSQRYSKLSIKNFCLLFLALFNSNFCSFFHPRFLSSFLFLFFLSIPYLFSHCHHVCCIQLIPSKNSNLVTSIK